MVHLEVMGYPRPKLLPDRKFKLFQGKFAITLTLWMVLVKESSGEQYAVLLQEFQRELWLTVLYSQ